MPRPPWWLACCIKNRALAGCGGARGAAALPAETGEVKLGQWGRAFLNTSTARTWHMHTGIRSRSGARAYLQVRSPGLRWAEGPRVCGWRSNQCWCCADAGAGQCWPAGHGAGGGVAQRRRIAVAWASAPGRRLETSVYFRICLS